MKGFPTLEQIKPQRYLENDDTAELRHAIAESICGIVVKEKQEIKIFKARIWRMSATFQFPDSCKGTNFLTNGVIQKQKLKRGHFFCYFNKEKERGNKGPQSWRVL